MLPAIAEFKFKAGENFNHPDKLHRDKHPYIEYFEDLNLSLTQKLGKRERFAKVS